MAAAASGNGNGNDKGDGKGEGEGTFSESWNEWMLEFPLGLNRGGASVFFLTKELSAVVNAATPPPLSTATSERAAIT
jgi:hypothetical protein